MLAEENVYVDTNKEWSWTPPFPFTVEDKLELEALGKRFVPLRLSTDVSPQPDRVKAEGHQAIPANAGNEERRLYHQLFLLEAQALQAVGYVPKLVEQELRECWNQIEGCWYQRRQETKVTYRLLSVGWKGQSAASIPLKTSPTYLLSVKQMADYLGIAYGAAWQLSRLPSFPAERLPRWPHFRVKSRALDAWMSARFMRVAAPRRRPATARRSSPNAKQTYKSKWQAAYRQRPEVRAKTHKLVDEFVHPKTIDPQPHGRWVKEVFQQPQAQTIDRILAEDIARFPVLPPKPVMQTKTVSKSLDFLWPRKVAAKPHLPTPPSHGIPQRELSALLTKLERQVARLMKERGLER